MKKYILFSMICAILCLVPLNAQIGKFMKNVKSNVQKDLVGTPKTNSNTKTRPEPSCACETADLIVDLGKYKIEYTEATISILDDGSILIGDRVSDNFYVTKNGVTEGPYKKDDPSVVKFQSMVQGNDNHADLTVRYSNYISKKGDKYTITFAGKTYGPYDVLTSFAVTKSGDKFAASVTPTAVMTEEEGKKLEERSKNATTDEEKMQIAMEYSQQMQKRMMDGGGPNSTMPRVISNMPVGSGDNNTLAAMASIFYTNLKYDDILMSTAGKVTDLQGKVVLDLTTARCSAENLFIKSDNSGYVCYASGTLSFSDGKKMTDLFNPYLIKLNNVIYLAYFYYSPKHNAIMQCKIPY
ncbi:MAG: hypothetical protein ABR974_11555 [Bacteroidales bacterium]